MVSTIDELRATAAQRRANADKASWVDSLNINLPGDTDPLNNPPSTDPPPVDLPPTSREPPSSSSSSNTVFSSGLILTRQISSIFLTMLLYTAAMPFEPFAWMLGRLSGTYLFDRLFGGLLLFCSFYFQYRISSLRASVIVNLPVLAAAGGPSSAGAYIQNGRVVNGGGGGFTTTPVWVWRTNLYWTFAAAEAGLLVLAEFGPSETLRRIIVASVVAFLWVVGFAATPQSYKTWAWGHIKAYLFFMVLDEIRRVAWSAVGANSNARRARQGRW